MRPAPNWSLRMFRQAGGPCPMFLWDLMAERATEKAIQRRERRAMGRKQKELAKWRRHAAKREAQERALQARVDAIVLDVLAARPEIRIEPHPAMPGLYRYKAAITMPWGEVAEVSGRKTCDGAMTYEAALVEIERERRLHFVARRHLESVREQRPVSLVQKAHRARLNHMLAERRKQEGWEMSPATLFDLRLEAAGDGLALVDSCPGQSAILLFGLPIKVSTAVPDGEIHVLPRTGQ